MHSFAGRTVLQITPDLRGGAAAQTTIDVAAALSKAGARALVASRGGRMVSELQAKGGVFIPFPAHTKNPLRMVWNIRRLARLIKAENVDLVHARSRAPAWVAYGATRLTKTPFVTSFQGAYAGGGALDARYNSVMARGDVVIADSAYAADLVADAYPAADGKARVLRVAHRGVDCRIFTPKAVAPARVQAVRRDWNVAPEEVIALLAAEGGGANGYRTLVEAARLLVSQGLAGTKFILVTDDKIRGLGADIDRAIVAARLQDVVRRIGPCPDMPAALLSVSVVVALSARPETFNAIAVEAQAMGTPVIVSDHGAASEIVLSPPEIDESLRTGWRTPAGDAAALAGAVIAALSLGATARDRLSLRARAHIESCFSLEQIGAATLEAYLAWPEGEADFFEE